ncbi:putative serine/threonine-protein kinase drkD [Porphyridium purpureum]|uniref:Putative serine/threonine-protein kinase drkD n=1 Tax=Porphyridium purpureum TaxID=35688 RepID=A0A5J4YMM0_PORPP|nr:putative serine/threonine-protein kinase drkD [Porphyridium purpureum]|eukprot:POR7678..scf244_11
MSSELRDMATPAENDASSPPQNHPISLRSESTEHDLRQLACKQTASMATSSLTRMTMSEMKELQTIFKFHDVDGEGLARDSFVQMMSTIVSEEKAAFMGSCFDMFDLDGDGRVVMTEFLCGFSVMYLGTDHDKLRYLFHMFDYDYSGHVDKKEFHNIILVMQKYCKMIDIDAETMSDEEVAEVVDDAFAAVDSDDSGEIDFKEFKTWAIGSPVVNEWLSQLSLIFKSGLTSYREKKEQELMQIELQRLGIVSYDPLDSHDEVDDEVAPELHENDSSRFFVAQLSEGSLQDSLDIAGAGVSEVEDDNASFQVLSRKSASSSILKPPPKAWKSFAISYDDLELGQPIGQGSFATVYAGEWLHMPVAIKVLHTQENCETRRAEHIRELLITECEVMSGLRHPNVLLYMGVVCEDITRPLCMVSEYFVGGSLSSWLRNNTFDESVSLQIALKCARGMLYLHSRKPPLLHRDLKSDNILVDETADKVVISDFGLSIAHDELALDDKIAGTAQTMAPEVMSGDAYTPAADVFSFGVVLWELFTHKMAWQDVPAASIMYNIFDGRRLPMDPAELPEAAGIPQAIRELITRMWLEDPSKRPTLAEVTSLLTAL